MKKGPDLNFVAKKGEKYHLNNLELGCLKRQFNNSKLFCFIYLCDLKQSRVEIINSV